MYLNKIISHLKFSIKLFYSVWKKDGVLGVWDHLRFFLKIRFQKVFAQQKFKKEKIVFISECPGASMRYRCNHVVEQLLKINIRSSAYEISKINFKKCVKAHEIIILHRVLHTVQREKIIKSAQKKGKIFIFDIDDLIFNLEKIDSIKKLPKVQYEFLKGEFQRIQKTLKLCNYAIGSTEKMKKELEKFLPKKCFIHENMLSDLEISNSLKIKKSKDQNKIIIGYASGTRTHDDDFLEIEEVLLDILKKYPQTRLQIVGHLNLSPKFEKFKNQIRKKYLVNWKKLPLELSKFDINLAPLENIELNEAKSDLKFFETGLVGVPTVGSFIGTFAKNIKDNKTGFLAKNKKEWFEKIEKLILDRNLRHKIGKNAQKYVQNFRNSEKGAKNFKEILKKIKNFDLNF